ncbi:Uma2 family endonuclease [Methylobacterium nonmethylotrophicum]|uniref:Uma2 family endonuclease n=1 Tax=Methylobacterium nonmethylotrophicum TaxID=1141884 RepID=A0A4Z0NZA9_9HYPH|nr:Uma2 family endonuclease [Methylobacterium nonmethylotrophicum]TGE02372.1 Uma2 family endonuclease [Methylobacterium nonmethylotrophicum]
MTTLPQVRMSVDEYLAWSEANPGRYELVNGEVFAMAPQRMLHAEVKVAVYDALRRGIRAAALACEAMPNGLAVRIDAHTAYEPDALVSCGPRIGPDAVEVKNPVIVVEVASPSTRRTDASEKLTGYFRVPSIHHYLMVDPDRRTVIHHRRAVDGMETAFVHEGTLMLEPPGLELPVSSLFEEP